MKKWGVAYWETYAPVENLLVIRSLLAISSIHAFPIRSINFVLAFPQYNIDVDVFMDINLVMGLLETEENWY